MKDTILQIYVMAGGVVFPAYDQTAVPIDNGFISVLKYPDKNPVSLNLAQVLFIDSITEADFIRQRGSSVIVQPKLGRTQ